MTAVISEYDYDVQYHKLSQFFQTDEVQAFVSTEVDTTSEYARILSAMNSGDRFRSASRKKEAMGLVAAALIGSRRGPERRLALRRTLHIVDSLKRPEEVNYLARVYGPRFVLLSAYAPRETRIRELQHRGVPEDRAVQLVSRDETGFDEQAPAHLREFGQATGKTFQLADLFLDTTRSDDDVRYELRRFFDLVFGSPLVTPKIDEHAMFLAFAASLRSGDLSRQVGAVVATPQGAVVAEGANDAPRAFGETYWPDVSDQRDIARGFDSNERIKERMMKKTLGALRTDAVEIGEDVLARALASAGFLDLTEFGRAVHAEMAALMSCAQRGVSSRGNTLYCTTYPCHNCTKHIVAGGIRRVVFIEPYPKSKAIELHSDAVSMTGEESKVAFEAFVGIGPKRYAELFALRDPFGQSVKRKREGAVVDWRRKEAVAPLPDGLVTYLDREQRALDLLYGLLEQTSPNPQVP